MRKEFVAYGAAVVLFGAVVLWAQDAPPAVLVLFFGFAAAIMLVMLAMIASVRRTARVLVVGEQLGEPALALVTALGAAGYDTSRCLGPSNLPCPALTGGRCPAEGNRPAAAVILRHPDEASPMPPCAQALLVPGLQVDEGSDDGPRTEGRFGRVGLDLGPEAVVHTLEELLAA